MLISFFYRASRATYYDIVVCSLNFKSHKSSDPNIVQIEPQSSPWHLIQLCNHIAGGCISTTSAIYWPILSRKVFPWHVPLGIWFSVRWVFILIAVFADHRNWLKFNCVVWKGKFFNDPIFEKIDHFGEVHSYVVINRGVKPVGWKLLCCPLHSRQNLLWDMPEKIVIAFHAWFNCLGQKTVKNLSVFKSNCHP